MSAKIYATALERQRAWREANKERTKALQKKWWDANKGKYPKKKKVCTYRKVTEFKITKAELDKDDIFYIQNHIKAGVPFERIAERACCDVSDVERIKKKLA